MRNIIQFCADAVKRAKEAGERREDMIRVGVSPMTPGDFLPQLWPKIHKVCPDMKFRLVPFDNTPESARDILRNLGYRRACESGRWEKILTAVVRKTRENADRNPTPSYGLIDSQSTKTLYASDERDIDGGKKRKGESGI